jgi:hypothetical protein
LPVLCCPPLPAPGLRLSEYPALKWWLVHDRRLPCPSSVKGVVTGSADDQRFALACGHELDPPWPVGLSFPSQVLERPHVVDLEARARTLVHLAR